MFPIKVCKCCMKNNSEWTAGTIAGFFEGFLPANNTCPYCKGDLTDINISYEEFSIIKKVSNDITFIQAMIKLKQDNIIEYESRMCQFRSQAQLQEQLEKDRSSHTPKCPTCGSPNIKPITSTERAASLIGLGIFSKKINKTYKCLNCKHTW
ncbi:hypothetical protein [Enterocloster lavalensis]|uniref:hypothetical protein n=1 Tax=Enterocloster lavalensis TaxID=460384 RepID=UPI002A8306B5|nr:hypothetical protein [Enterocloster lavalensis]